MKTPDEIKKGLEYCITGPCPEGECPYYENGAIGCGFHKIKDAHAYIQQLEAKDTKQYQIIAELNARYSQVSKALCGTENATLEDVLRAVSQVKEELALVVLQRDAAVDALGKSHPCENCIHFDCQWDEPPCSSCLHSDPVDNFTSNFEWRGVCPENTKEDK